MTSSSIDESAKPEHDTSIESSSSLMQNHPDSMDKEANNDSGNVAEQPSASAVLDAPMAISSINADDAAPVVSDSGELSNGQPILPTPSATESHLTDDQPSSAHQVPVSPEDSRLNGADESNRTDNLDATLEQTAPASNSPHSNLAISKFSSSNPAISNPTPSKPAASDPSMVQANQSSDSPMISADPANSTSPSSASLTEPTLSAEAIANLTQMLPALTQSIGISEAPSIPQQATQTSSMPQPIMGGPTAMSDLPYMDEVAIEHAYEEYAAEEKRLIETGTWDPNLPEGSRLFVGNLSDRATKKEVFRVLCPFGEIIQILLKGTYGFVQYKQPDGPRKALDHVQGYNLKGRPLSLEISTGKPYVGEHDRPSRRQRHQGRGNSGPSGGRGGRQRGGRGYPDDGPYFHGRDRGLSPPPRGRRGFNEDIPGQYLHGDAGRGPSYRGSPPAGGGPLPPRYGSAVPEVQIIAIDEPDRNYIRDTEAAFRNRRVYVDVMSVSARFNIPAAVRQMVGEGVQAVVFLDRRMQVTGVVSLQIFEPRPRGQRLADGPLRYEEYNDITMARAVEHFLNKTAPGPPSYGGGYGQGAGAPVYNQGGIPFQGGGPATYGQPAPSAAAATAPPPQAQLASFLSTVDPNTLANLLTQAQQRQQPQVAGYSAAGLSYSQTMATPAAFPGLQSQPRQNGAANSALDNILKQLQRK